MAANGITVLDFNNSDVIMVPVASATVIERGDPISYESSLATVLATVTDDIYFAGIALDDSVSGDTNNIRVATRCLCQVGVSSASYTDGQGLKYASGAATTVFAFADDGNANTIGWSTETKTTVTSLKVLFDAHALRKLFEVNA